MQFMDPPKETKKEAKGKLHSTSVRWLQCTVFVAALWIMLTQQALVYTSKLDKFGDATNMESVHPTLSLPTHNENTSTQLSMGEVLRSLRGPPLAGTNHTMDDPPLRVRIILMKHNRRDLHLHSFGRPEVRAMSEEVLNIVLAGMYHSPYFQILRPRIVPDKKKFFLPENGTVYWVVDMRRFMYKHRYDSKWRYSTMKQLLDLANHTLIHARQQQQQLSLKIVLMDYRDPYFNDLCEQKATEKLHALVGRDNVRLVARQVVKGRKWKVKRNFTRLGRVTLGNGEFDACLQPIQIPYTVRSTFADAVLGSYHNYLPTPIGYGRQLPPDTVRPVDVAHYWSINNREENTNLRNHVSETIQKLQNVSLQNGDRIQAVGDFVSSAGRVGRSTVQSDYLEALMTTKIAVVAQRDGHENHYRLMEAMVGGGMVMSDPMLSLPTGYVNGTNIIIYSSLEELHDLALYYLDRPSERIEIARNGWKLAMNRHRTYHWMEDIFFGQPLTNTSVYL